MQWWHWRRAGQTLDTWVRTLLGGRPYRVEFKPGAGSYVNMRTKEIVVDPQMADGWGGGALLPFVWRGTTVRTLSALQWRISRAMARHESGHVLFTDDYGVMGELHAWLTNALEDQRMEWLTGQHYGAARADFAALAALLWQKKPLASIHRSSREDRLLNACLFWRWDWYRPKGALSRWRWGSDAEQQLWEEQIRPLVEEAWAAPTAVRVAEIALEILRRIGMPQDAGTDGHDLMPSDLVVLIGDTADGALGRDTSDLPLERHTPAYDTRSPGAGDRDDDEAIAGVLVNDGEPPTVDSDPSAGNIWMQPYRPLQREVGGQVRRLLKVLLAPTPDVDVRASDSRGLFCARAHVRSQGETPLLHKRVDADDPSGLAMVLLIDRTGSMGGTPHPIDWSGGGTPEPSFEQGRMPHARRAAMLLDMTCTAADIPLCIGYAGNSGSTVHHPDGNSRSFTLASPVIWIRDWRTPREAEGPRALLAGMYGDSGSECVSESLRLAQRKLAERSERTKVIIYLHDGRPTDELASAVKATVERVRKAGHIVIGLFVGSQREVARLEAIFGKDDTIGVDDLTRLPDRLGRILLRYARKS
jgi:hypothetical protein